MAVVALTCSRAWPAARTCAEAPRARSLGLLLQRPPLAQPIHRRAGRADLGRAPKAPRRPQAETSVRAGWRRLPVQGGCYCSAHQHFLRHRRPKSLSRWIPYWSYWWSGGMSRRLAAARMRRGPRDASVRHAGRLMHAHSKRQSRWRCAGSRQKSFCWFRSPALTVTSDDENVTLPPSPVWPFTA